MQKIIKNKLMQWLGAVPREHLAVKDAQIKYREARIKDLTIISKEVSHLRRTVDHLQVQLRCEQHKYNQVLPIINRYVRHGDEYTAHNGEITISVSCTHSGPIRFSSAHSALTHALNKMTKAGAYTCTELVTAKDQAYKVTS